MTLRELFYSHVGLGVDKWERYLDVYENLFQQIRDENVCLLEIGVQNGGSLQIWKKYFEKAKVIVGCDLDAKCGVLELPQGVKVAIGDANDISTINTIREYSATYDVIIDDGSHMSQDIIDSFIRYFPLLSSGGYYIIEDLHCSYWRKFGGGLNAGGSAIEYFKSLCDVINFEHWEAQPASRNERLENYSCLALSEDELSQVFSVCFSNSMCVIKKIKSPPNDLGARLVRGSEFPVRDVRSLDGKVGLMPTKNQST